MEVDPSLQAVELIHSGKRALTRMRCCIAGVMTSTTLCLFVGYWVVVALQDHVEAHVKAEDRSAWTTYGMPFLTAVCCVFWKVALCFAPLMDSVHFTKLVVAFEAVFTFCLHLKHDVACLFGGACAPASQVFFGSFADLSTGVLFLVGALIVLRARSAAQAQAWMYRTVSAVFLLRLLRRLVIVAWALIADRRLSAEISWVIPEAVGLFMVMRPRVYDKTQACFRDMVKAYGCKATAAGIAGFIGAFSAEEALVQARARFRVIRADRLLYEDFQQSSVVDVPLCERTDACPLGNGDAFVSHSWHDDVDAKWTALQTWRRDFVAAHAREPLIWFDKACIDQSNITDDLRVLPLFLNGCRELLVLAGPTYLTRLWCVVELFTFVHMGGCPSRVTRRPLLRPGRNDQDLALWHDAVQRFDGAACKCFNQADKQKMSTAILTAFGTWGRFNQMVRAFMDDPSLSEEAPAPRPCPATERAAREESEEAAEERAARKLSKLSKGATWDALAFQPPALMRRAYEDFKDLPV